ncbi:MAG: Gfo/Idh/MocA family oxidoreductase [Pirellulaceae bacterium]|nr:Gfo/Idh/MocA family oxidoreductase [Pirellulaceae bacterium]
MSAKRRYSRREMLRGCAAGAIAMPLFVSARALGREAKAPASERVTVGHIGVGGRGRDIFHSAQSLPEFQSVAAADCYADRRESTAAICKGTAYRDFRDLLGRKDIDAVIIATPDHWHVPIGILAARAGKHVYIEKPLGVTVEQDLAIERVIEQTGRIFQYGTQQRSLPHCWVGCELVRRGVLGKLHTIEVDAPDGGSGGATTEAPVPTGLDFDMWCGPSPLRPYTPDLCQPPGTYWVYSQSIGYLGGWGAHPLDIMVWGSRADLSGPVVVEGTGVIPTEGLYDCVYKWDMSIMLGDVRLIFRPGADRTKFIGDQGWIQVARELARNGASDPAYDPKQPAKPVEPQSDSLPVSTNHSQDFIQAIKDNRPAVSHVQDAVRSDLLSLLCDIAVRTGEKIVWDPQTRSLVNPSAEAKALLSRPMRSPWTL